METKGSGERRSGLERDAFDQELEAKRGKERATKRLATSAAVCGIALIVAISLGVAFSGCGKQSDSTIAQGSGDGDVAVASQTGPRETTMPASTQGGSTTELGSPSSPDSLPPEVVAHAPDSLAVPGSVVEITAEGSADVVEMVLTDRNGKKQPFTYDAAGKIWHVYYRVPLRPRSDRVAVSVTARNDSNRWSRVWVFLGMQGDPPVDVNEEPVREAEKTIEKS